MECANDYDGNHFRLYETTNKSMHLVATEDIAFVCIVIIWSTSGVGMEVGGTYNYYGTMLTTPS